MKLYKCDCCDLETNSEVEIESKTFPARFITLDVRAIGNDLPKKKLLYCGKQTIHFCSINCLTNYLLHPDSLDTAFDS